MKEAKFYEKINDVRINCKLCPHSCIISNEKFGNCNVRKNISGKLFSMNYSRPIALNIDPIEKKPLYHFLPSKTAFSIGTNGCNLHCSHCQNWDISQCKTQDISFKMSPEEIIKRVKKTGCEIIAYTYTEPTIFYEYMEDIAKLAKKEGIKNIIVSNGFINEKPLKNLCKYIDAANIDLKSINDEFYRKECKAWINPILDSLKLLKKEVWLEITNLIIPNSNDSAEEINNLLKWIKKELGDEVPIHFTAFYPCYKKKNLPQTPVSKVKEARKIALELGLKYVYAGNIPNSETNSTYCPKCNKLLIKREGYRILENNLEDNNCKFCKEKISGVWS